MSSVDWNGLLAVGSAIVTCSSVLSIAIGAYFLSVAAGASPDGGALAAPFFFVGLAVVGIGLLGVVLALPATALFWWRRSAG